MAVSTILKISHEACGQDANKARGEAKCFVDIKAAHRMLYLRIGSVSCQLIEQKSNTTSR